MLIESALSKDGTGRRIYWSIAAISLMTIAAYGVAVLSGIPPVYLVPLAVASAVGAEYMLIRWALGLAWAGDRTEKRAFTVNSQGAFAGRARIADLAFRGRTYSQKMLLGELRSMLVERAAARTGLSYRQLSESVHEKGALGFFGSRSLAYLYMSSFSEQGNKSELLPPEGTFRSNVESILEDLEHF